MARDGSVAPKERINVKFVPATGGQQAEVELPLKMVVLGDFTGRASDAPVEQRKAIDIDKNNFGNVMKEMDLERTIEVANVLNDTDPDATLRATLTTDGTVTAARAISDQEPLSPDRCAMARSRKM